jgi:hypothetical protein
MFCPRAFERAVRQCLPARPLPPDRRDTLLRGKKVAAKQLILYSSPTQPARAWQASASETGFGFTAAI